MDTIFALSSAPGRAGVALVRVSGPGAALAARTLCGSLGAPRRAVLRGIVVDGQVLDTALVTYFVQGQSFTGDDTVELAVHGSGAVVRRLLEVLSGFEGLRPAGPGEFTQRAFDNGRMDLAQVEALADLIDAETEAQRRLAVAGLGGVLAERAARWREALVSASALVAAAIDFADEDVPDDVLAGLAHLLEPVMEDLRLEAAGAMAAERLREGFEVAIVGEPNVGKSTLLNFLAGRRAAITSEVAGTTRDVIEVRMEIAGLPVTLLDTAGIRDSEDTIERIGVDLARERAAAADLRLVLSVDGEVPSGVALQPGDIVVRAKADLGQDPAGGVSGLTGVGVQPLLDAISGELAQRVTEIRAMTQARHRSCADAAHKSIACALREVRAGTGREEFVAENLRSAMASLDTLVGKVGVEDILGEVFSRFCIGK